MGAHGGAGEPGRRLRGEGAERGEGPARGLGGVQVAGAVAGDAAGAAGDHQQGGRLVEALGERGEPAQGLLVGPVDVVDEQDQRPLPAGQPAHSGDQTVAHALRVGLPFAGFGYAEGGAGDVVPVAEVVARLLREHGHEGRLQQLPYDVEGDGAQGLAAARRPDGAAAGLGDAAGLGQQRGLAQSRLAPAHQQAAGGRTVRAQGVHRLCDGGDFLVALPEGGRGCGRGPYLRHPATSPCRPNDVQTLSLAAGSARWWTVGAPVAVTGDMR
ncbi:hypothetical protein GCM10010216_41630 [Streptomyces flaveolus]|nr:hypothetical protein GCM10010216_41630 [Streptomyces flaveolus]